MQDQKRIEQQIRHGERGGLVVRDRHGVEHYRAISKKGRQQRVTRAGSNDAYFEEMRLQAAKAGAVKAKRDLLRLLIERGDIDEDEADRVLLSQFDVLYTPTRSKHKKALRRRELGVEDNG